MKQSKAALARIKKLIDQADRDGVSYTDLVRMLKPLYSSRRVEQILREVRKARGDEA